MDKKQKILSIGLIIILAILMIICCFVGGGDDSKELKLSEDASTIMANAEKESAAVSDEEKKEFNNINVDTYLEYYNGEEEKLVLIASPTCQYCQIAEPIIQNIAYNYNIDINYLNTNEISKEDGEKLMSSDEFFSEGFGTPLLLIVSNGQIKDKVDGLTDKAHYVEFFKNYEFIK